MSIWYCSLFHSPFSSFLKYIPQYSSLALNYNLGCQFKNIWSHAEYRVAVDGGANHVFNTLHKEYLNAKNNSHLYPNIIKGDLDSIQTNTKLFYKDKSKIIIDNNQDTTDLQKALQLFIDDEELKNNKFPIVICGGLGGSLSHVFANINSVFSFTNQISNQIYLLSDNNMACIIPKGIHTIYGYNKMFCSFIPLGSHCSFTSSSNLKYPLDGLDIKFGSLISTSNEFISDHIIIENLHPLLFIVDSRKN